MNFKDLISQGEILSEQENVHDDFEILERGQENQIVDIDSNNIVIACEVCGKEGEYEDQESLCDFCYTAEHNLGQSGAVVSQADVEEESLDEIVKVIESQG